MSNTNEAQDKTGMHSYELYKESDYLRGLEIMEEMRIRSKEYSMDRFPADDEQEENKPAERHNTMSNGTRNIR